MIKLFRITETDFSHNEWILSEAMLCKISEEINSDFTMELEYPLQDTKDLTKNLVDEAIVQAPVRDYREDQQFRIIHTENTTTTKIVQCQAKLLADLKENRVRAMTIVGKTRSEAIQYVLDNTLEKHNYRVGNLDNNTNRNVIVNVNEGSALSAIIGSENSILSEYGGEFIVDNDTICIVDNRGFESNTTIEYGKNIIGIKETTDLTNLATVLIPKVGDLRLPEYFIKSPLSTCYSKLYWKELDIQGINVKEDSEESSTDSENSETTDDNSITKEEAYIKMREACNKSFSVDHVDMINHNYEVDFISLRKTEEYKYQGLDALEDVQIGNKSIVKHKILNIDLQGRINKYVYDVLLDNLETISFGFKKQDITNIINDTVRSIQFTKQEILLKVSNVQNTLSSQLKILETGIYEDIENTEKGLSTKIEKTAEGIHETIKNTKEGLETTIEKTAEGITESIVDTKNNLQLKIKKAADELSSKVSKGDEFSSEFKQNVDAFKFLFNEASENKTEITKEGLRIYNGGIVIYEDGGSNRIFYIARNAIVADKKVYVKDLQIKNTDEESDFYDTLRDMEKITTNTISCKKIYVDNEDGDRKHLYDYIVEVLENKGLV